MLLTGKFAVITGAASARGIGRATAQAFAAQGAKVAILDLDASAATEAAASLRGHTLDDKSISTAMDAAHAAADPQPDMRGSAEYKRSLIAALLKRAIDVAARRARGEHIEVSHIYA